MKSIKIIQKNSIAISIILAFITASFTNPIVNRITNDGDFTKKSYFEELFSNREVRKLNNAYADKTDAAKDMTEANTLFARARALNQLKNNARGRKEIRRADRKEQRALKQAYRKGFRAYSNLFDANQYIYYTYDKRIREFNNDRSNHHHLAERYAENARKLYSESLAKKRAADDKTDQDKYRDYREVADKTDKAVELQEKSLALFMKDKSVDLQKAVAELEGKDAPKDDDKTEPADKPKDADKTSEPETQKDTTQKQVYKPDQDPNVYKSLHDSIIAKLNITNTDKNLLQKAKDKEKSAAEHIRQVENLYAQIDAIEAKIDKEKDRVKKEMLKQDAVEIEARVFRHLSAKANLYIEANDIRFELYSKYFSQARPEDKAGILSEGLKYEESARELKLMSTSSIANANLQPYVSERYLRLMNAVQLQLSALQEQENAYAVYFGWKPTPLTRTVIGFTPKDKIVDTGQKTSDESETDETGKTDTRKDPPQRYSYNYSGSYVYTKQNPQPKELKHPKGTVYRVQVGVYKDLISVKTFGDYSPIVYDTFHNNPFKRFMVGEYISSEAAEHALESIKKMNISDAFIVAYTDGVRTTYRRTDEKVTADTGTKTTSTGDSSKAAAKEYPDFMAYGPGPNDFAKGIDIKTTKGLKYTVQVGMYKMPKTNAELKNISPLYREVMPTGIRYLSGIFNTFDEAKAQESKMKSVGFGQAYVVAYQDGHRIDLSAAKAGDKTTSPDSKAAQPNVYFAVQLGAYSSQLPPEKEAEFNDISQKYTISAKNGPRGLIIYTVGQFLQYTHAQARAKELKVKYPDVFVVAFKNEQRIPVADALKILGQ